MSNNQTIIKNTLFLYFRMILVMGVSLYTSRIVLKELGVSDYGIYSLVGGFISLFGFFNGSMSGATQRYLAFALGEKDDDKLRKTFSATLTIHFGIAVLVFLLAESIGLWYVNNKMVFPPERSFAVNIVYQFSVLTSLLGIIQVPYNALIISRERMNIYAYVSLFEVFFKLIIIYILISIAYDKLILYSFFTFILAGLIRFYYQFYCKKHYEESHYKFEWDKDTYSELIRYSSWNMFGNIATLAKGQGNNMVLNLFFGTTVNAAYGIMETVKGAISSFIINFQTASNPQIIKLYAQGEVRSVQKLINQASKFSFFLSLVLVAPFYLNVEYILLLWLEDPPEFSGILIRLALMCLLVDSISGPLMTGVTATGKIKNYQLVIGFLNFINLPISYFILKFRIINSPEIILYVWFVISIISLFFRLFFLKKTMNFDLKLFILKVILKIIIICLVIFMIGYLLLQLFEVNTFLLFVLQTILYFALILIVVFVFGIESSERKVIIVKLKEVKNKLFCWI